MSICAYSNEKISKSEQFVKGSAPVSFAIEVLLNAFAAIGLSSEEPPSAEEKWRGTNQVGEGNMTAEPGVFAGGDLVNDTADAISAVADGLRAVEGICDLLIGKPVG